MSNLRFGLILIALGSHLAQAEGPQKQCFGDYQQLPAFLRAIADSEMSSESAAQATAFACVELQDIETAQPGPIQDHARFAQTNWDFPMVGPLSVKMVEWMSGIQWLQLADVRRDFALKLAAIKRLDNPYERLRRTYELVNQYQGKYDNQSTLPVLSVSPKDTLNRSAETSYGGVCRQFAALLAWSLNQVATPALAARLTPDFTAQIVSSWSHMWVRVTITSYQGDFASTETIDLDNTDFFDSYVPLRPRTAIAEVDRARLYEQCRTIQRCLGN